MTKPIKRSLPSVSLTIIYCLVSSIFIHAQNNSIADNGRFSQSGRDLQLPDTNAVNIPANDSIPFITAIKSTNGDSLYGIGSTLIFEVTFDQVVYVQGGKPVLQLKLLSRNVAASYVSGDSTNTLVFTYTVNKGDTTAMLDYTGADALLPNGAGIRNSGGAQASLSLPAPGSRGSIAGQYKIVIDGNAPLAPVILQPVSNTVFNQKDMLVGGNAEPNTLVTVYIDGNILTTVPVDNNGNWSSDLVATAIADGNHNLRATATDAAGNEGPLSALVPIITDVTVPTAISVVILSNNKNASFATTGDVITVYFSVDDVIFLPEISIAGQMIPVSMVGAKEYVARYTVTKADVDGQVPFSVSFSDLHGNKGAVITAATDNSKVYIDQEPPAVTLNTIEISPLKDAFLVYISFSEAIADFDISHLHATNAIISDLKSISNNVMTVLVTPQYDGLVTVSLSEKAAHDAAGNPSTAAVNLDVQALFSGYFLKVYPNPVANVMHLQFTGTVNDRARVTITSYRGVVVYEKEVFMSEKILTLDVSSLQPGAYIVRMTSKNYSFYTNVMVVR